MDNKPGLRTSESLQLGLRKFCETGSILESKGVVASPVLPIDPMKVVFPYLHVFMGTWQKIWDFGTDQLYKLLDNPYIAKSPQARQLNVRIIDLDKQQQAKAAALSHLQRDLEKLKTEQSNLTKYLNKLQKGARFPKLRQSIKDAQSDVRDNGKKQSKLKLDIQQLKVSIQKLEIKIKELAGPMSVSVRRALRDLGVELTVYWSGAFVGPQITKLMDQSRFRYIFIRLREALDTMRDVLTDPEIKNGEHILSMFENASCSFFKLLSLVKVTTALTPVEHIPDIQTDILNLSCKYREFIPGPVTTKFHLLEAHLLQFVLAFGCSWPYSEEGVESAHHWIRLFREKTSYVTG